MLLGIVWNIGTGPVTITSQPSGWTQVGTDVINGSTVALRVLRKTATSGDVGASYSFGLSVGVKSATFCLSYTGATGVGEVETNPDSAGTTHAAPALTSMQSGGTSWALNIYGERSTTNTTWAKSAADTLRTDVFGSGGAACSLLVADSNAGETTWAAQTATAGISSVSAMMSLEILATAGISAPGTPTSVSAVAGDGSAVVSFTPGSTGGAASVTYTVTSTPGSITATGSGSPVTIVGLTNGTGYTFKVTATNTAGSSSASSASSSVTPAASTSTAPYCGILVLPSVKPPPPAPTTTLVGIAPPASSNMQSSWDETGGVAGVTVMRSYNTAMPATWAAGQAAKVVGPTLFMDSAKPDVATTIGPSHANDSVITKYAQGVPAGTYLTFQHEPENKNKGITPGAYGQFIARCYGLVKSANPAIKFGCIVMTYTSNVRDSDSYGNIAGRNVWLEAVQANGVTPDFVGYDGYQGNQQGTSITDIFTAPTALAQGLWPGVEMVCAEYGYHTTPAVADSTFNAWLINGYPEFQALGYTVVCYWDGSPFTLDASGLATLGSLG